MSSGPVHNGGAFFLAYGAATELRRCSLSISAWAMAMARVSAAAGPNARASS